MLAASRQRDVVKRRALGVMLLMAAFLVPMGSALALPVNADEITSAVDSGAGLRVAAVVISVGLSCLGVLVLARFLHAAVDAA